MKTSYRGSTLKVERLEDKVFDKVGYVATIPILGGTRKAGGIGETELGAVSMLCEWLAAAAKEFDLDLDLHIGGV